MTTVRLVARPLLAAIFVAGGARALRNPEPLVDTAKPVTDTVSTTIQRAFPKAPADAATLIRVNGAVQVTAGLALATGRMSRVAALMLAASLVPTTAAAHRFWEYDDPQERQHQQVQFMKNLGLGGGLLLATVDTGGRPSVPWRATHAMRRAAERVRRRPSPR